MTESIAFSERWHPMDEPLPLALEFDIRLWDGSILCYCLAQADGDIWWSGAGTGEKFIDPKYTNVTAWRIRGQ